jgi:hypothetical protein
VTATLTPAPRPALVVCSYLRPHKPGAFRAAIVEHIDRAAIDRDGAPIWECPHCNATWPRRTP